MDAGLILDLLQEPSLNRLTEKMMGFQLYVGSGFRHLLVS